MQLSLIPSILLLTSFASAAPVSELHKRDMCTMVGYYNSGIVVGSGGPGQAPVSWYRSSLSIEYVGGVNIRHQVADGNSLGHRTFGPRDTNLPNDIAWAAVSNGLPNIWLRCTVDYEGRHYEGGASSNSGGPGEIDSSCRVDFGCEGGLRGSK